MRPARKLRVKGLSWLALVIVNSQWPSAWAQGTAFTYQGRVEDNGSPADGIYSFTFALYPTNSGGAVVAGPVTNSAVVVTNGLFTTVIDFGLSVWNGQTNWLQVGVAANGAVTFTPLAPRQLITPVPVAIYSQSSGSATSLGSGTAQGQAQGNSIASGDLGVFVGGGFDNTIQSSANYGTIGGGDNNTIGSSDSEAFIGGGTGNFIQGSSPDSVIVGGFDNTILTNSPWTFIGGGVDNRADANASVIVGGSNNLILPNSSLSVVVGGSNNIVGSAPFPGFNLPARESFIGGGAGNTIAFGYGHTLSGGIGNSIYANDSSTLSGGSSNGISISGSGEFCTIGGGAQNFMYGELGGIDTVACTIGGGELNSMGYAGASTVAGGLLNIVDSFSYSTIGGGFSNRIGDYDRYFLYGNDAAIGGGAFNFVVQDYGTIGGGVSNTVAGSALEVFEGFSLGGTVSGGVENEVTGPYGTIPGGLHNLATNYAFAAGYNAQATNQGAFVWSDSTGALTTSLNDNSVTMRASGGFVFYNSTGNSNAAIIYPGSGSWNNCGDSNITQNSKTLKPHLILEQLEALPITEWSYKTEPGVRHLGPMAQDFYSAFAVGENDTTINTVDEQGVALAAIQALNEKLDRRVKEQEQTIQALTQRLARLERIVAAIPSK